MKIAIDVRNIGRGRTGSEVVVTQLTKYLIAQNSEHDDEYFLLTDTDDAEIIAQIRRALRITSDEQNVHIVSLSARNKFVWAGWSVWRWMRQVRPDVYHTEYIVPFFVPKSVRIVTHIHDVSFAALPQLIGWKDRLFLRTLIPWSLRRAAAVIAISEFTKQEISKYYQDTVPKLAQKLHLVPNAVGDEFKIVVARQQIAQVRERYDLPTKYIFSLGTMQPRKNMTFLVQAFAQMATRLPDVDLVLSGRRAHNFDCAIDAIIAQYGSEIAARIHFTGFIDGEDLPAVYAGARLFAFPSLYEGFGLPILEAMSQQVPVVTSDIPVFREVAGESGALFAQANDSANLAQFAENMYTGTMNDTRRAQLIACGSERACAYSWSKSAKSMYAIFVQVTKENKSKVYSKL